MTNTRNNPIAITGIGLVSAAGRGVDAFWDAFSARRTHLGPLRQMPTRDLVMSRGGQVATQFFVDQGAQNDLDRAECMAAAAMEEAMHMADLEPVDHVTGLALGTALGSAESVEQASRPFDADEKGWSRAPLQRLTGALAHRFGLEGPRWTFSVTCVSGLYAVEQAVADLVRGRARSMVCGGLDTLSLFMQSGFCSLRALSQSGEVRPFDRGHDGIVLGEGAAFVVLEQLSDARARGARVLALLAANRLVSDATHLTSPDGSGRGMAEAIAGAMREVELDADALACVTPTAVGSPVYDAMQSRAVIESLGECGRNIPVTTWEPVVGHALASTGVLGIVHAVLVLERDEILPTFGLEDLDDACALDYVLESSRPCRGSGVLALTVGFGGQNGATIIQRPDVEVTSSADMVRSRVRLVASRVVGGLRPFAGDETDGPAGFEPERLAEMFPGRWNPRRSLPRGVDVLIAAIAGAVEEAGWWTAGQESLVDGGLVVGTDYQSLCVASSFARDLMTDGPGGISPGDFLFSLPSSAAAVAGILFGLRDHQATLMGGGLSGFLALGHAVDRLETRRIPRLVVVALSLVTPDMRRVLGELGYSLDDNGPGFEMAVAACLEADGLNGPPSESSPCVQFRGVWVRGEVGGEHPEIGGNAAGFPDNSFPDHASLLEDLPPGYRVLAAPSLLAVLRGSERVVREKRKTLHLVHRDPTEAMAVALTIEP